MYPTTTTVYEVPLPPKHRFPMDKYRLVRQRLQRVLVPGRLATFDVSPLATQEDLNTVHCPDYVRRYMHGEFTDMENRRVGFPWSPSSVERALSSVGGTVAAMHALGRGEATVAAHVAGGTHHAFRDRGEGFCVFSDIAVAAGVAMRDYPRSIGERVLVIDLDVHQGNGNAVIFEDEPRVFTFSAHCEANYFSAVQHSDADVELREGMGDDEYMRTMEKWLPAVMRQADPTLVFYQAGVDGGTWDRLGKLKLSREGLRRRNALVMDLCAQASVPVCVTMGGGYPRDMSHNKTSDYLAVVEAHADCYIQAAQAHAREQLAVLT